MSFYKKAKNILFDKDLLAFVKSNEQEKKCTDKNKTSFTGAWREKNGETTWGYFIKAEESDGSTTVTQEEFRKAEEKEKKEVPSQEGDKKKKITVFFVEDNKTVHLAVKTFIEGHKELRLLDSATNGKEALEKLKNMNTVPDVILMDIAMPKINGIKATEEMLKFNPSLKIIILTAYGTKEYIVDAFAAGAIGFLRKDGGLSIIKEAIVQAATGGVIPVQDEVASEILNGIDKSLIEKSREWDNSSGKKNIKTLKIEMTEEEFIEELLSKLLKQIKPAKTSDYKNYIENFLKDDTPKKVVEKFILEFEELIFPEEITQEELIEILTEELIETLEEEIEKLRKKK